MGTSDNFSLRWNDFESNIQASFRDFRQSSELYDVTLCCDNGTDTLQAHKLVLAACSPLFRKILNHNRHQPHPFLYLKGINLRELRAVLDYMYNGEVSVAQDWLNNFLMASEELAVKGLATGNTINTAATPDVEDGVQEEEESVTRLRRGGRRNLKRSTSTKKTGIMEDPESSMKRIKAEPDLLLADDAGDDLDETDDMFPESVVDDADFVTSDEKFAQAESGTPAKGGRGAASNPETRECLEEARFSRTKQGNALLIDKAGYCYLINRKSERKIYWKCQRKTSKSCRSNCQTEGFYITRKTAEHTHPPYPPPRNKYTEDY